MIGRVIAIPTGRRGDYLDFWSFIKDDGREIPNYAIRIPWSPACKERIHKILVQAKKDFNTDLGLVRRDFQMVHTSAGARAVWSARSALEYRDKVYTEAREYVQKCL